MSQHAPAQTIADTINRTLLAEAMEATMPGPIVAVPPHIGSLIGEYVIVHNAISSGWVCEGFMRAIDRTVGMAMVEEHYSKVERWVPLNTVSLQRVIGRKEQS